MDIGRYKDILKWIDQLDGVVSLPDLKVAFDRESNSSLFRAINSFIEAGELIKVKRGIYATPTADLANIARRICPKSYISTGAILASRAIISSVPVRKIQAIKIGAPRRYTCTLGTIEFLSISPKLFFGFDNIAGKLLAKPEKAFLDVCYYYYKGKRFSFNPQSDVAYEQLDQKLITKFLKKYDQRFQNYYAKNWE